MGQVKKIDTITLLTLSEILDTFESFNCDLENLLSNERYRTNDIYKVYKLIKNEKTIFISKSTKAFYQKHVHTIRLINKYMSISQFIISNYTVDGKIKENSDIEFFYNYLMLHRDELDAIQKLIRAIKELKIYHIEFDENLDFSNQTYTYDRGWQSRFIQLEGMYLIPTYSTSVVNYGATNSHYAISCYDSKISLNSLAFSEDLLPNNISRKHFDILIEGLIKKEQDRIAQIRHSVNLNVGLEDLKKQFETISKIINELNDGETKDNLVNILLNMQTELSELQSISAKQDDNIIQNTNVSKKHLEDEKKLYYNRRFIASLHYD